MVIRGFFEKTREQIKRTRFERARAKLIRDSKVYIAAQVRDGAFAANVPAKYHDGGILLAQTLWVSDRANLHDSIKAGINHARHSALADGHVAMVALGAAS